MVEFYHANIPIACHLGQTHLVEVVDDKLRNEKEGDFYD